MINRLHRFAKTPTSFHVFLNMFSGYLGVAFSFFYYLIFARILGRIELGVLGVLLTISYVVANILDLGTTQTIYAFVPGLLKGRGESLYRFLKTTFYYQLGVSAVLVFMFIVSFPFLDTHFFKTGADPVVIGILTGTLILFMVQNFVMNMLYASKQVVTVSIVANGSNVVRITILLLLVPLGMVNIASILFVIGIIGSLSFLVPIFILKRRVIRNVLQSSVQKESFKMQYTVMNLLATQIFNLAIRMDLFLLSFYGLKDQLGSYSIAQKIILSILTAVISITQVLSPDFSHIVTQRDARRMFRIALVYMSIPIAAYALIILTPDWIFSLAFTAKFADTAEITKSLAVPYMVYSVGNIALLFMQYSVKKPSVVMIANSVFFILMTAGCYYLIPQMGVLAPARVIMISLIAAVSVLAAAGLYEYRRLPA